jgi:precorrin-6B methylase 2
MADISLGTGTVAIAARLLALRQAQKAAALADDWVKVDAIEAQIRELEAKKAEAIRAGSK